uniref:C2H2-type domain-containing protein n=1 Tax=Acrobeloides nanus TaxID=290746 RepID=A0A914CZI2_9BILA
MGACKNCGAKYLDNATRMSHHLRLQCKKISDVEKKYAIQLYSKKHPCFSATTSDHPGTSMNVGNNPNISYNDLDEFQRQADSLHCRSNSPKEVLALFTYAVGDVAFNFVHE